MSQREMNFFEAVRAAVMVLEPQIAIMCVGVYLAAWYRGIRPHAGILASVVAGGLALALEVMLTQNGLLLLATLIAQQVTTMWWLITLIREIGLQRRWSARIEIARQLAAGYRMVPR